MFFVFCSGGKQYQASEGQIIHLEKLNAKVGSVVELNKILMISNNNTTIIGTPLIGNCIVKIKIIAHCKNKKISVIKFKRRKHHCKHIGHRQWFTKVEILECYCPV